MTIKRPKQESQRRREENHTFLKYYFRNCKFKYIYIINTYNKPHQCVTFFIEVSVPRQVSEKRCICLLGVSILPLFASILIFDVGFVQKVWYFFHFHFIKIYSNTSQLDESILDWDMNCLDRPQQIQITIQITPISLELTFLM